MGESTETRRCRHCGAELVTLANDQRLIDVNGWSLCHEGRGGPHTETDPIDAVAALVEALTYLASVNGLYDRDAHGAERQAWRDVDRQAAELVGQRTWSAEQALAGPGYVLSQASSRGYDRARAAADEIRKAHAKPAAVSDQQDQVDDAAGRVRCIARPTGDRCALCGATGLTGPEHFEPAADSPETTALADRLAPGGDL